MTKNADVHNLYSNQKRTSVTGRSNNTMAVDHNDDGNDAFTDDKESTVSFLSPTTLPIIATNNQTMMSRQSYTGKKIDDDTIGILRSVEDPSITTTTTESSCDRRSTKRQCNSQLVSKKSTMTPLRCDFIPGPASLSSLRFTATQRHCTPRSSYPAGNIQEATCTMIADQYHEGERNMNNCNNTSEAVKNKANANDEDQDEKTFQALWDSVQRTNPRIRARLVEELVAVHNTNNNNDDNTNF